MKRCFEFNLNGQGLDRVRFLVFRESLPTNGDAESAFLDGLTGVMRHAPGRRIPDVLTSALDVPDIDILVVIRNPNLVLDPCLPGRIAAAIGRLPDMQNWSLAGAGGLGPDDRRHMALYASDTPALPECAGPQPLLDLMPDLYLVNAAFARQVLADTAEVPDAGLEPVLATEGYLDGRIAIFLPDLGAGIVGGLMSRDLTRLSQDLNTQFADRLSDQTVPTLSGPIQIRASAMPDRDRAPEVALDTATRGVITRHADPLTLSVVVRTRFDRPHLLARLLTSLSRARLDGMELEVILSSDADRIVCQRTTRELARDFCNLNIRLQHNRQSTHSRVGNMVGGITAARHDYVALIDDDDYLDLFAFDVVAPALFMGNRPLIVTSSVIHDETWEETPSGRWVLTHSGERGAYGSDGWRRMFSGVNRLPICALLIPRDQLVERLSCFEFRHDLSEDYALFLLVLTDPNLPAIFPIDDTFCHISVRGTDNTVTMKDRRPWVRDITGFLADLVSRPGVAGPGLWALLAQASTAAPDQAAGRTIADLRKALDQRDENIALLRQEISTLRRQQRTSAEPMA